MVCYSCQIAIDGASFRNFFKETAEEIKKATVNGFSTTCAFALNERATLKEVRNKKDKNLTGNFKAHKIPTSHLVPEFVAYIKHRK